MASNPPGNCCAQGFRHTGTTFGSLATLDGIEYYLTGDESLASSKLLMILTDVMGHTFINLQLLADEYAKAGYFVVLPDILNGDPSALNPPPGFDLLRDWVPNHTPENTQPIIDKVVATIQVKWAPKYFVATGYCFGAKYVVRLLGNGTLNAGAIFHPSFVTLDEVKAIKGPLYIGAAETDVVFPANLRHDTEDALKEMGAAYRLTLNHGVSHGFAVRGDISNPWVKYAKERAFADAVDWFRISYETAALKN